MGAHRKEALHSGNWGFFMCLRRWKSVKFHSFSPSLSFSLSLSFFGGITIFGELFLWEMPNGWFSSKREWIDPFVRQRELPRFAVRPGGDRKKKKSK